jgi:long-chain acyl-CoA synthetase
MFFNFKNHQSIAIINQDGSVYTYKQLSELIKKFTDNINKPKCLVICLCNNNIASIIAYIGLINQNSTVLMLSAQLSSEIIEQYIEKYQPAYIWAPNGVITNLLNPQFIYEDHGYSLFSMSSSANYAIYKDLSLLLTTSGTTGSSKLVRVSDKNLHSNTLSIIKALEISSQDRAITTLPMNYTYGLSIINTHLYLGASIILTDKNFMQKEFWSLVHKYRPTSISGVPYSYEILDKLNFYKMDLSFIKYFTQAGGKLKKTLHVKLHNYVMSNSKKLFVMYGQTEATARMTYLPFKNSDKYGSIGVPIPDGRICLVDEINIPINDSYKEGELIYFGPNVALGYAENYSDLSKGDEFKGRLNTGDIAFMDNEGFYYITGRKTRFIKIYGNRVNLDDLESILQTKFEYPDIYCIGEDDSLRVITTNQDIMKDIKKFIFSRFKINQSIINIDFIPKIPRNESGKLLYSDLLSTNN